MNARIVVGANYGDEGKGTVVATLTKHSENVLNVLTNGGAQRGHSILTEDGSITYQHFGSGTYYGADNYYSRFFILHPMQFVQEYNALIVKPGAIYRDWHCRWTTPYDVMANLITEQQKKRHASCCMGIWNTVKRTKEMGWKSFDEFISDNEKAVFYLQRIKWYYERNITIPKEWKEVWDSPGIVSHFLEDCKFLLEHTLVCPLSSLKYKELIFENGQGLLLNDTGFDTFDTTPSKTGIEDSLALLSGLNFDEVTAHYVTRPYLTRHGDGHIQAGVDNHKKLSSYVQDDRTNRTNEFQGEFRYGALDIANLKERIEKDAGNVRFEVDLTHCDEMDRVADFKKAFKTVHTYDSPLII